MLESLTMRPPEDMRQLMRHIEEYKRLEDDRHRTKASPGHKSTQAKGFPVKTPEGLENPEAKHLGWESKRDV